VFFGIPFGKSTEGDKRFTEPTFVDKWSDVYNATYLRPYCPQLITPFYRFIGENSKDSEDCLFLNIYVPNGVKNANKLPVIYWVYGGAFILGMSDMYPGEDLALTGEVIVVTVNYRIGVSGFLSTGDRVAEGNYGLWDQLLGLRWVNQNIEAFGGDRERITIMGQSAGAASVSHLSLSPLTKGLFQRVIAMSGAANAYFAYTEGLERSTKHLGLMLLCPYARSTKIVNCLRNRRVKILESAAVASPLTLGRRVPNWVPRVDGYLVSDEPRRALQKGLSKNVDLMIGSTQHDGAMIVYVNPLGMRFGDFLNICKYPKLFKTVIALAFSPYQNRDQLVQLIQNQYPDMFNFEIDLTVRSKSAVQMITDFVFLSTTTLEAEQHSKFGKETGRSTYLYEFAYRQSFFKYKPWIAGSHLDDLYSAFGKPFMKQFVANTLGGEWSKTDMAVSNMIQQYYANFAHTGNPNEGPHTAQAFWPQFNTTDRAYIKFQKKGKNADAEANTQDEARLQRISFWNDLFYKTAIPGVPDSRSYAAVQTESLSDFLIAVENTLIEIEHDLESQDYGHILQALLGLFKHLKIDIGF